MVTCLCQYNIHRLKSQSPSNMAAGRELGGGESTQMV